MSDGDTSLFRGGEAIPNSAAEPVDFFRVYAFLSLSPTCFYDYFSNSHGDIGFPNDRKRKLGSLTKSDRAIVNMWNLGAQVFPSPIGMIVLDPLFAKLDEFLDLINASLHAIKRSKDILGLRNLLSKSPLFADQ